MELEEYLIAHTEPEPDYLAKINRATHLKLINPRMLSGHLQGRLLSMICHMIAPKRILELGTYAGYSALCMAEALDDNGHLHTIEADDELEDFIRENLNNSAYNDKITLHIGSALEIIPQIDEVFDFVFIDADKREYIEYFEAVLPKVRKGGFIIADNTLWDGKIFDTVKENDYQTKAIIKFNDLIAKEERVEKLLLPFRDGLSFMRKK